jgi:SpoVK/Ycf46/Vps4 family AAA+-type ATPase
MKAEFMTLWDGLGSSTSDRVLVLGATNRPDDIDSAIWRRLPKRFNITLPDFNQRRKILEIIMKDTECLDRNNLIYEVAAKTEGYSGSDIKELCRNAVMVPIREKLKLLNLKDKMGMDEDNLEVMVIKILLILAFSSSLGSL